MRSSFKALAGFVTTAVTAGSGSVLAINPSSEGVSIAGASLFAVSAVSILTTVIYIVSNRHSIGDEIVDAIMGRGREHDLARGHDLGVQVRQDDVEFVRPADQHNMEEGLTPYHEINDDHVEVEAPPEYEYYNNLPPREGAPPAYHDVVAAEREVPATPATRRANRNASSTPLVQPNTANSPSQETTV